MTYGRPLAKRSERKYYYPHVACLPNLRPDYSELSVPIRPTMSFRRCQVVPFAQVRWRRLSTAFVNHQSNTDRAALRALPEPSRELCRQRSALAFLVLAHYCLAAVY